MPDEPVKPLSPPNSHHLNAAIGWLELGNHVEAGEELKKITPKLLGHPDVLAIRWQIAAAENKWLECLEIASAITRLAPDSAIGWNDLSISLYRLGKTTEAYETLKSQLKFFPKDWPTHYNMACYSCQLGFIEGARQFLENAIALGNPAEIKARALEDPDLELLWKDIRERR